RRDPRRAPHRSGLDRGLRERGGRNRRAWLAAFALGHRCARTGDNVRCCAQGRDEMAENGRSCGSPWRRRARGTDRSGMSGSEIQSRAKFDQIRYAQVWEDADILAAALRIRRGDVVVSIASAGDNALALLAEGAERVIAADLN